MRGVATLAAVGAVAAWGLATAAGVAVFAAALYRATDGFGFDAPTDSGVSTRPLPVPPPTPNPSPLPTPVPFGPPPVEHRPPVEGRPPDPPPAPPQPPVEPRPPVDVRPPVEPPRPAAPVAPQDPTPDAPPACSNAVLARFGRGAVQATASSEYGGPWLAGNVVDGNLENAWYSRSGDHAGTGKPPWLLVTFPDDAVVRRVLVWGSRDAAYPTGYRVLAGRIELLDKDGKVLAAADPRPAGQPRDFDFTPPRPVPGVRAVRFTVTADEGQRGAACVAVTEVQVE